MASRESLHLLLCDILGSKNVYFQPPENLKINYPCIIYSRSGIGHTFANDDKYLSKNEYTIIFICKEPDNNIVDKISKLKYCRFNRFYASERLNHYTFTINF